jgi:hypothetical protein
MGSNVKRGMNIIAFQVHEGQRRKRILLDGIIGISGLEELQVKVGPGAETGT